MSFYLDQILVITISDNEPFSHYLKFPTLKAIVGYRFWDELTKAEKIALGIRFRETCALYGYKPTLEKLHLARIYENLNLGGIQCL